MTTEKPPERPQIKTSTNHVSSMKPAVPAKKPGKMKRLLKTLMIFFIGYMSSTLVDFDEVKAFISKYTTKNKTIALMDTRQSKKPKLEFYTALTNSTPPKTQEKSIALNVNQPQPEAQITRNKVTNPAKPGNSNVVKPATPKKSASVTTNSKPGTYQIQAASFRYKTEACRMKASLIIKGFSANIVEFKRDNIKWYRVMIGPYESKELALKAQLQIAQSERVNGMVRRMDA